MIKAALGRTVVAAAAKAAEAAKATGVVAVALDTLEVLGTAAVILGTPEAHHS